MLSTAYFFLNYFFISVFLAGRVGFSLVAVSRGYSVVGVHGFLIAVASLTAEHGL